MATRKDTAPKARAASPDLSLILGAFCEALAVMECALTALDSRDSDDDGPEPFVLRLSFDMLNAAYKRLDDAIAFMRDSNHA